MGASVVGGASTVDGGRAVVSTTMGPLSRSDRRCRRSPSAAGASAMRTGSTRAAIQVVVVVAHVSVECRQSNRTCK